MTRFTTVLRRATFIIITLFGVCLHLKAQDVDSNILRPSFGANLTSEVQTDFERVRIANLLHLQADVPLSSELSFQVASISTLSTKKELGITNLLSYSNIETYDLNIPFALTVAGFTWQLNDQHSLFAGIRRTDEDYFCSDGLALFTNSSYGIFPTLSANFPIGTFPYAALGIHYSYDNENLCLQASLYNGEGNYRFTGRENIFRICPKSDGVFAIAQAEYRYLDSHYYLGTSIHTEPNVRPTAWVYAEQALMPNFTLLAAYGHAFGNNDSDNFCALGGKYTLKGAEFGLFTDYTRVLDIDEWATEFICRLRITDFLSVKPVLHVLTTDGNTKCVGILRVDISI